MKKKKIIKTIFCIAIMILILAVIYNIYSFFSKGKQSINVKASSTYYGGSTLSGLLNVEKNKNYNSIPIKAKVKIDLIDKDEKRVKNVKRTSFISEKSENNNFEINLPDNIEGGNYYLKITSKSGLLKDTVKVPIQIFSNNNSDAIISFDKGIYKPGDEIN